MQRQTCQTSRGRCLPGKLQGLGATLQQHSAYCIIVLVAPCTAAGRLTDLNFFLDDPDVQLITLNPQAMELKYDILL